MFSFKQLHHALNVLSGTLIGLIGGAMRSFLANYHWSKSCFVSGDASVSAEKVGAVILDGMGRFIHLQLNLFLLKIHSSMATVLLSFGRETMLIMNGKALLHLSLLLIFIQLGIVAGMFFDEQIRFSTKEGVLSSLILLLINLSGILPKISLTTSVNLPFLLLFALMVL